MSQTSKLATLDISVVSILFYLRAMCLFSILACASIEMRVASRCAVRDPKSWREYPRPPYKGMLCTHQNVELCVDNQLLHSLCINAYLLHFILADQS